MYWSQRVTHTRAGTPLRDCGSLMQRWDNREELKSMSDPHQTRAAHEVPCPVGKPCLSSDIPAELQSMGNPCQERNTPEAPQPVGNTDQSRETKEQSGRKPLTVGWQKGTITPRMAKCDLTHTYKKNQNMFMQITSPSYATQCLTERILAQRV